MNFLCKLFGHDWDYSYGLGINRCLRCGAHDTRKP